MPPGGGGRLSELGLISGEHVDIQKASTQQGEQGQGQAALVQVLTPALNHLCNLERVTPSFCASVSSSIRCG